MATMQVDLHADLIDWRRRLEAAVGQYEDSSHLAPLISEVDLALQRMKTGTFGICESCNEEIEDNTTDPIARFCLGCLNEEEQQALENDLENVTRVQYSLLPKRDLRVDDWRAYYHYEAAGPVGGDYCDLVRRDNGDLFFVIGDVSGKGIAASMLMAHLHATFRSLLTLDLPVESLVERANQVFADCALPSYYATLVFGKATSSGIVEICNAGHCPPLVIREDGVTSVEATGLPVGMFCREKYQSSRLALEPGDTLLLYTDGLTESRDSQDAEYGTERLMNFVRERRDRL